VSILWGVENCPFPLTKAVAVNTGLALPRSQPVTSTDTEIKIDVMVKVDS